VELFTNKIFVSPTTASEKGYRGNDRELTPIYRLLSMDCWIIIEKISGCIRMIVWRVYEETTAEDKR
jgi:hypothetical protein